MPHFHRRVNEPLGMIHTSGMFPACRWGRKLRFHREIGNFLIFHSDSLPQPHTSNAARVNEPLRPGPIGGFHTYQLPSSKVTTLKAS